MDKIERLKRIKTALDAALSAGATWGDLRAAGFGLYALRAALKNLKDEIEKK